MNRYSPLSTSLRDPHQRERTPDPASGVSSREARLKLPQIPELDRRASGMKLDWSDVFSGDIEAIKHPDEMTAGDWLKAPRTAIQHWHPPDAVVIQPGEERTVYHELQDKYPDVWASHQWIVGDRYLLPARKPWILRMVGIHLDSTPQVVRITGTEAQIPREALWMPNTEQLLDIAEALGWDVSLAFLKRDDGTWAKWVGWVIGREEAWAAEIEMDEAIIKVLQNADPSVDGR